MGSRERLPATRVARPSAIGRRAPPGETYCVWIRANFPGPQKNRPTKNRFLPRRQPPSSPLKDGLERDGLGDLVLEVGSQDTGEPPQFRSLLRRPRFTKKEIYLPKVLPEELRG